MRRREYCGDVMMLDGRRINAIWSHIRNLPRVHYRNERP
jgi:hypothetical protein